MRHQFVLAAGSSSASLGDDCVVFVEQLPSPGDQLVSQLRILLAGLDEGAHRLPVLAVSRLDDSKNRGRQAPTTTDLP